MALEQITDHAQRADDTLPQQYRDAIAPGVRETVQALAFEAQDVEDGLWSILAGAPLGAAVGYQLERIGALVGEPRNGLDDDAYRIRVGTRILINRSSGKIEDVIAVFAQLTGGAATIEVREQFPAAIAVRLGAVVITQPDEFARALRLVRKAGVRSILEYTTAAPGGGFCFSGGAGRGFPDALLTPGSGGLIAGAKE